MVLGDLRCLEVADPHVRLKKKLRLGENNIHVCTPNYRPPDVWLGSQQYEADLDMWSFGCVAAEIYSRQVLINPAVTAKNVHGSKQFLEAVAAIVPALKNPWQLWCPASWLEDLPFFGKWYECSGKDWLTTRAATAKPWPPRCLEGCPFGLSQLILKCLVWHPSARMTVAEARTNSFLTPPGLSPLHVLLHAQRGKNGVGTIARAELDPDLLRYLQTCPSWSSLARQRLQTRASISKCIATDEAELRLKTEIPGFVDEENPQSVAA